jgi:HEAT repeat protein
VTGTGEQGPDITIWQFWWGFNKDPYLNLKAHIHGGGAATGSDEIFLGHGESSQAKESLKPSEETIRSKIVPALLAALEKETNNDIVTACLIALAKIGDEKAEDGSSKFQDVIRARLSDPVQEIRETAAVSLGILANPASIELLEHILDDTPDGRKETGDEAGINYRTRAFAAYGLGLIGYRAVDDATRKRIVGILWRTLQAPRFPTRDIKVAATVAMGIVPLDLAPDPATALEGYESDGEKAPESREQQVRYLIDFFKDDKNDNRHFLERAHAPRAIALLLNGAPASVRAEACEAFESQVGQVTRDSQREIRMSCTLALGQIGTCEKSDLEDEIREALMNAADDPDQQVKNFSMIALAQIGGRAGQGENPLAARKDIRDYLGKKLASGKSQMKPWAGLAVGVMERAVLDDDDPQSTDLLAALRQTLQKEDAPKDVGAYAIGAGIARDLDSEAILMEKLDQISEDEARGDIAVALGLMNSVDAMEKIQKLVQASKHRPELLKSAAIALGLLGDKGVVTDLVTMLEEANTLATQAAIASALGFIGDTRSVDPLIDMLNKSEVTDRARAFAAVALGIVADKEPLPWNSKISVDLNYRASTTTLTSFQEGTGILDIL